MENLPRWREEHGAAAAFEQPHPDLVLQFRDETADRGLLDSQLVGGGGEALVARGSFERPEGAHPGKRSLRALTHNGLAIQPVVILVFPELDDVHLSQRLPM